MTTGHFLVFEGLDGCGKTTQIQRLATQLRAAGRDVVETAEPTRGPWGRTIREMAQRGELVEPEEELRWFLEDRREHTAKLVRPALESGCDVLSDRYYLSTVAYQGARGLDWERILELSEQEFPVPDVVILLEVDAAAGLARVRHRGHVHEPAFEEQGFLEKVGRIFDAIDRPYVERIDGRPDADTVAAAVRACVTRRLPGLL